MLLKPHPLSGAGIGKIMEKIRKTLLLSLLFSKRLLKKTSFRLLLCAVPLLALGMRHLSAGDSGILHIVLCQEDPADALSGEIVRRLLAENSVIQYTVAEHAEEACVLVESGRADAAWIFPGEMQERLDRFTGRELWEEGVVRVVEKEDNVALRLAREKLFGAMYSHVSYSLYRNFVQNDLGLVADVDLLFQSYESTAVEGSLFRLARVNGIGEASDSSQQDFLVAPVRGMLALLVLLCGLAATMYFLQDQARGVLDAIPFRRRRKYLYLYQLTAIGIVSAAALTALALSGVAGKWYREIAWMAVYAAMCMGFCSLLQRVCGNLRRLAALVPVLMLLSFIFCPVFFSLGKLKLLSCLLPSYYYLNVIHNGSYAYRMLLYCVIAFIIDFVCNRFTEKFRWIH